MNKTKFRERFHTKSGCWIWDRSFTPKGYGQCSAFGETLAHRVAWILFKGEIPQGKSVLHSCDNKGCVNPEHLFLGDNFSDMRCNGFAKLSENEVREIRGLFGKERPSHIAKKFGVSRVTIWGIQCGKFWKGRGFGE